MDVAVKECKRLQTRPEAISWVYVFLKIMDLGVKFLSFDAFVTVGMHCIYIFLY